MAKDVTAAFERLDGAIKTNTYYTGTYVPSDNCGSRGSADTCIGPFLRDCDFGLAREATKASGLDAAFGASWQGAVLEGVASFLSDRAQAERGQLASFSVEDGEAQSVGKVEFGQVFSPGLYARIGFPDSPFTFALGGSFTPDLRKDAAGEQSSVVQLGGFLAVDVTVIPIVGGK